MDMQKKHASDLFSIAELSLFDSFGYLSASSPIGLVITDTDGVIIGFNKAVQDLLGVRIEDYRNTNVCDWYANPEDRQRMLDLIAASGTVRNFEVELKHQNGSKRTVLANIDLIEREGEHVLLTSVYDITQYIEQQRSRIQADENFRNLFSDAPVGITVTDVKGNLVVNNNAISELLGYNADELKDISIRDFYLMPDDRKQLLELTRHLGSVRDFETKFRHKNGSTVSVLLNTDIIEFNGQPNMLLTSIRDITYLKHAEDELIKERDFSNAILNIAATLTVVINHTGVITRFSRACEQASGIPPMKSSAPIWRTPTSLNPILHPKTSRNCSATTIRAYMKRFLFQRAATGALLPGRSRQFWTARGMRTILSQRASISPSARRPKTT